jgi:hypothetical protein
MGKNYNVTDYLLRFIRINMKKVEKHIDFSDIDIMSVIPKLKPSQLRWMEVGDSIIVQYILKHNSSYFIRVMRKNAKFTQKKMILIDPITCNTVPVSLITRIE